MVAHLQWFLIGIAAQLLGGTEPYLSKQLVDELRRWFEGKGMEEKFQTELRCRHEN